MSSLLSPLFHSDQHHSLFSFDPSLFLFYWIGGISTTLLEYLEHVPRFITLGFPKSEHPIWTYLFMIWIKLAQCLCCLCIWRRRRQRHKRLAQQKRKDAKDTSDSGSLSSSSSDRLSEKEETLSESERVSFSSERSKNNVSINGGGLPCVSPVHDLSLDVV